MKQVTDHPYHFQLIPAREISVNRLYQRKLNNETIKNIIAKFDYRNAAADWKNSKDAVSRSMQKLQGLHPADPPYKKD